MRAKMWSNYIFFLEKYFLIYYSFSLWIKLPGLKNDNQTNPHAHLLLQEKMEIRLAGNRNIIVKEIPDFESIFSPIAFKRCRHCGKSKINYFAIIHFCQHIQCCYDCKVKIDRCIICGSQLSASKVDKIVVHPILYEEIS